jgi:hypothetical protein
VVGGGEVYSYIRVLPNGFLLKAIVFTVCEHEYMNIHTPPIIASGTALKVFLNKYFYIGRIYTTRANDIINIFLNIVYLSLTAVIIYSSLLQCFVAIFQFRL